MGSIGRVMIVVLLLAIGCGGVSSRSPEDGMNGAGSANGGTSAATTLPQPVDLGDGDHPEDGRPVVPIDTTGGFFWRGCGNASWRIGNWWVTSDRQRDAFPREIDPPRGTSTEARGATGADLLAGAVLWVELDHPQTRSVSLTGCSAVSFWARLESSSSRVVVALNEGSRGSGLLDGQSILPSRTLDVSPDWQEFVLPFASFPGLAADDLSLASIEFFVGDHGEKFDLWVDELALVCSGGCP
jgi:hypothetical protein